MTGLDRALRDITRHVARLGWKVQELTRQRDEARAEAVRWACVAMSDDAAIVDHEEDGPCPQCDEARDVIGRWSQ